MKRHPLTLATGIVVAFIFLCLLFLFQVRQTEVAVVTWFGKPARSLTEPGAYFRLPWPFQTVHKFDKRIHNFERKFEQTMTRDANNLIATAFIGWRITDPRLFLNRFNGDVAKAENTLEGLVRDAKNAVIGLHPLRDFISPDPNQVKFDQIEQEMLAYLQDRAREAYGIEVVMVGIKQLGLPESITGKVFERMKAERERMAKSIRAEGESRARVIKAEAEQKRQEILAQAQFEATTIRAQAEAEAAKSYAVFEQNPELAIFLFGVEALPKALKEKTTLIVDPDTPPLNLLRGEAIPRRSAPAVRQAAQP